MKKEIIEKKTFELQFSIERMIMELTGKDIDSLEERGELDTLDLIFAQYRHDLMNELGVSE